MSKTPTTQPSTDACHEAAQAALQSLLLSFPVHDVVPSVLWHMGDLCGALVRANPERYKLSDILTMLDSLKNDVIEGATEGTSIARSFSPMGSSSKPN